MAARSSAPAEIAGRALLASKLRRPEPRPGLVTRRRLDDRLTAGMRATLTLVSGPAGFGKTTLVSQWWADRPAADESSPADLAWVSLDDGDNDAVTFWAYLTSAIQRASGAELPGAAATLRSTRPSSQATVAALLNDLEDPGRDLVLALDDYHLIDAAEIHDAVAFLLDHLPPRVHVLILTRSDPPLPLARLRARGQLVEVRAADLRFTPEEARSYLGGTMALVLTDRDADTLAERTEGWIAALQLAALSLQHRDDASAFVATFAGDDRYVVDYLAEEVLAAQTAQVRDFLLRTSILPRLSGALCDAVTGQAGGSRALADLDRANLFLVPLDDRREWYRYHHLFAEVLRAHLIEQRPDEVPALHLRASAWSEANDLPIEAVRHALAGGDPDRAADLMERTIPQLRRERREAELASWVHALPEDVLRARPVLGIAFVGALAQVSDFATIEDRLAGIERSVGAQDGRWPAQPPPGVVVLDEQAYRALPAAVQMYRAALALFRSDLQDATTHATRALELAPPGEALVRAGAGALGGLAAWAGGDLSGALAAYTESAGGLRALGHHSDVLGCTVTIADLLRTQGRLTEAIRTCQDALDLTGPPSGHPLRGAPDMHVAIAEVLLERDDVAGAVEHLETSRALGDHLALPQNPYRWRVVTARLREAEGDLDAAQELLDEADRVYAGDYSPNVRPVPSVRARLRLRRGELTYAEAWAREQRVSPDEPLTYLREHEHVTLARVLLARHEQTGDRAALDAGLGLLDRLLAAAESGGRLGTVMEILILQAGGLQARGEADAGSAALRRAVELGEPEGYVRLFADEGAALARQLSDVGARGSTGEYVRRLLAAIRRARRPVRVDQAGLVERLSERELEVLRLLATDLDGPAIAGHLHVSLNTLRTHSRNIFRKLDVTSRRAAVRRASTLGLLP